MTKGATPSRSSVEHPRSVRRRRNLDGVLEWWA